MCLCVLTTPCTMCGSSILVKAGKLQRHRSCVDFMKCALISCSTARQVWNHHDLVVRTLALVSTIATSQQVTFVTLCTMIIKMYATANSCCLMPSTRHDASSVAQAKGNADMTHLVTQDAVGLVTPVVHHPLQTELLPTSQQLHEYQRRLSRCCKLPALGFYLCKLQAKHEW